jgi:branched-chain amino acid transport system permease protein
MTDLAAVLFDGVVYASWLFMMAAGLTLIYGVMKILNIAHGSLYALGAYAAASLVGAWLAGGHAPIASYALLAAAALAVGLVMGPLLERGLLRLMYGKDEVVLLLVTYAVFLILEDAIKLVWGVESLVVAEPYALPGNFNIGTLAYPVYNLILIGAAMVIGLAVAWGLYRTRPLLLAVIHDREMSAAMGINVDRMYLLTFTIGATLAAAGGALTAPTIAVSPGIGVEVIVLSFAVVVIGGLGSLGGAALGALMVGVVRSVMVRYWPEAELFTIYLVMALVLIARPKGLFAAPEARKI